MLTMDSHLYIINNCEIGAWLSLVEHLAWDQGVAGSNPAAPTIIFRGIAKLVRHGTLTPVCVGSSPAAPTIL